MLVYALGVTGVANAYNNANTLPNAVYDLMLGGILTSVVVPLLVSAAKRDSDGGEAYDQRMFTLATSALLGLTVVATLAAGLLVDLYAHAITGAEHHLMVIFAYFFIPQIFFYGVSSLAGGILNARGHFAAPMWTPVINNVVVIVRPAAVHRHRRHRHRPLDHLRQPGPAARLRHDAGHHRADRGPDPVPAPGGLPAGTRGSTSGGHEVRPRSAGWPHRCSATC